MFPEMARECAYKGADIMIRTAGYTAPIRHAWHVTNQANAFCNLMVTASVCMCGSDGTFDSMGEAMIVDYDGTVLASGGGVPDEIVSAEVRPSRAEARCTGASRTTSTSSAIVAMSRSRAARSDCPYTYMRDLVAGSYACRGRTTGRRTDGTAAASDPPTRGLQARADDAGARSKLAAE